MAPAVIDTRFLFRPLSADIVSLFRALSADDWNRPTVAGSWRVRDVAAHLVDTALRRLSYHRDGQRPPTAGPPGGSERDFVAAINAMNAVWIRAADRFSPRVLTDLYAAAGARLADFFESLSADAPALFPVSWAGDARSAGWFDIGREFTEVWHHGAQIRDAVGAGPFSDSRWLRAVLRTAAYGLPHAYRDVEAPSETALLIQVTGPAGGAWTLQRRNERWTIEEGAPASASATATMTDETAWRLLFNALPAPAAEQAVRLDGDVRLARPLLRARSVIV